MKETNWMKTWGGNMMGMYGISQVSIIDVRPEEEFKEGHIPFVLNTSFDEFKNNINNPEKIESILGAKSINL